MSDQTDVLQGTLDLLVMRTTAVETLHGCAHSRHPPQPLNLPQPAVELVPTREIWGHQLSRRSSRFRPAGLRHAAEADAASASGHDSAVAHFEGTLLPIT